MQEAERNVRANLTEIPIYQVNRPAQMAGYDNFVGPAHIRDYGHFNQPTQNYGRPVQMGANASFNQPGQTTSCGRLNQPGCYGNFVGPQNYRYLNGQARLTSYGQPIQPPSYGQLNGTAQLCGFYHFGGSSPTTSYRSFNGPSHIGSYGQFNSQIRMVNPGQFRHPTSQVGGQSSPTAHVGIKQPARFLNSEPQQPTRVGIQQFQTSGQQQPPRFLNSEPQPARFLNSEPRHRFTATPRQLANEASHGQQQHQAQLLNNGQRPASGRHHPYARPELTRNTNSRR